MSSKEPTTDSDEPARTSPLPTIAQEWTISGLAVDNLRALRIPEPIALRRLMLVVGRNGIGKSTLARVFPLLGQSAGDRTREPILWWARNGVDFGSFSEAKRHGQDEITFGFEFTREGSTPWRVTSTLAQGPEGCRVARIEMHEGSHRFQACFDREGRPSHVETHLHGHLHEWPLDEEPCSGLTTDPWRLFGIGRSNRSAAAAATSILPVELADGQSVDLLSFMSDMPDMPEGWDLLSQLMMSGGEPRPSRSRGPTPYWRFDDLGLLKEKLRGSVEPLSLVLSSAGHLRRKPKVIPDWNPTVEQLEIARRTLFFHHGLKRIRQAESLLDQLTSRMAYIGPFRAIPERDYRHQSVAVEALDPRGENLAMFIAALKPSELRQLNAFLQEWLDFRIVLNRDHGRYTLRITIGDRHYNLLDVGFGYSQVLPVAVQLWASGRVLSTSRSQERTLILAIEQPELHLHPHHQVLIGKALAASAMDENGPIQIVETHSDHLVSEIGLLVARGQLDPERVGVLCVEPHEEGSGASVRVATFDDDGVLQNWPAGFLAP